VQQGNRAHPAVCALVARGEDIRDDIGQGQRREIDDRLVEQPRVALAALSSEVIVTGWTGDRVGHGSHLLESAQERGRQIVPAALTHEATSKGFDHRVGPHGESHRSPSTSHE
jgi:hypothetical protein